MMQYHRMRVRSGSGDVAEDYELDGKVWAPVRIVLTTEGGSGFADVELWDKTLTPSGVFDSILFTIEGVGSSAPGFMRIEESERIHWMVWPDRKLHIAWSNPDSSNMIWGLQVTAQLYEYDESLEVVHA